jgi:FtsH-binding integral membrane protein
MKIKISKKIKIAIVISIIAFIAAVANIFLQNESLRCMIWGALTIVWAIDYIAIAGENTKRLKELTIANYEILLLKSSYIEMGEYIDRMNIPALADIETRIDNELNDIEIKKAHYVENLK